MDTRQFDTDELLSMAVGYDASTLTRPPHEWDKYFNGIRKRVSLSKYRRKLTIKFLREVVNLEFRLCKECRALGRHKPSCSKYTY